MVKYFEITKDESCHNFLFFFFSGPTKENIRSCEEYFYVSHISYGSLISGNVLICFRSLLPLS